MKFDHIITCNGETSGALVDLLAEQMQACGLALTASHREAQELKLIGMQQALRATLPGKHYREILKKAETIANWN